MSGFIEKISPEIKKQDTIEDKKDEKKGKMSGIFGKKPPEIKKPKRIKKKMKRMKKKAKCPECSEKNPQKLRGKIPKRMKKKIKRMKKKQNVRIFRKKITRNQEARYLRI